jgi:hypothetical protein
VDRRRQNERQQRAAGAPQPEKARLTGPVTPGASINSAARKKAVVFIFISEIQFN